MVFDGSVDDEAIVESTNRGLNRGNTAVKVCVADVERGFQPLQDRSEFREFEGSSQWRRDRTQLEAGIVGDHHFGPVHHMNGDAITGPDAARRQSACKAYAALCGRVCAWCVKAPVRVVFIGWSPVADMRHPNWTGCATARFPSRKNGCDCRLREQTHGENRAKRVFLCWSSESLVCWVFRLG